MMKSPYYIVGIMAALLASGCSTQGEATTSKMQDQVVNTVLKTTSQSTNRADLNSSSRQVSIPNVIIGTYAKANYTAVTSGTATVGKLGDNLYHIDVVMTSGYSHHTGEISSDFSWNGDRFVFEDHDYADVRLTFTSDGLQIQYEDTKTYGGVNAEPKGRYYLLNSIEEEAPFLNFIYDAVNLPDSYRHGKSNVYIYNMGEQQNKIVYIQSYDKSMSEGTNQEYVAIYEPEKGNMKLIGEPDRYNYLELSRLLRKQGADDDVIYQVLRREYADRLVHLKMKLIDQGDTAIRDDDNFKLSAEQAFYIVTGVADKTTVENNVRDKNNIGSIFIQEVDHQDNDNVTIHIYELVRNSEEDIHTATNDWLEVDRVTGRVRSSLFDNE